ncbi:MAG: hypothetical protein RLZZ314_606 [Bacteroidota bacterium]|jgi:hypothetical protein
MGLEQSQGLIFDGVGCVFSGGGHWFKSDQALGSAAALAEFWPAN